MSHAYHSLFASAELRIGDYECHRREQDHGSEEVTETPAIAFIRAGAFELEIEGKALQVDSNHVLCFNAGVPHRIRHSVPGGDRCTVFELLGTLAEEFAEYSHCKDPSTGKLFPQPVRLCEGPGFGLHHSLVQHLQSAAQDHLTIEESVVGLIAKAVREPSTHQATIRRPRRSTRARHREIAEEAKRLIARHHSENLLLEDLATALCVSRYHLCRVFRAEVGMTVHRYLNRVRLRMALERILSGRRRLTNIALEAGFSSHAHFDDAFRQEFGAAPSAFRQQPSPAWLRDRCRRLMQTE